MSAGSGSARAAYAPMLVRLVEELERTQWEPARAHLARQRARLGALVAHAARSVPFYQGRLDAALPGEDGRIDLERFARLPVLTRAEVQAAGQRLVSEPAPEGQGASSQMSTTGSTGRPLRMIVTDRELLHRMAVSVRRHRWRGRDARGRLALIRYTEEGDAPYPAGLERDQWESPVALLERTGPMFVLDIDTPVARQLEWLVRVDPHHLATYPSNLQALLLAARSRGLRLPSLRDITTFTEALPDGLHALCAEVWDVPLADNYSAVEAGSIATQCPESAGYHVHDELVRVEILDEAGREVEPGELGRVVVTPLFNLAMPLVRYALGDYARRAGPCACGRGLSTLDAIAGRTRNMLRLPDGDQMWPLFGVRRLVEEFPVEQFQLAQIEPLRIEARLVVRRTLSEEEERALVELLGERLDPRFAVTPRYVDAIERGAGRKYEDFVCELT